ncbi:19727_t:CDS:2 [Rhizophagus irregularis]|nr:19727_t:CDS:2 [Rhizophagus irregularis]
MSFLERGDIKRNQLKLKNVLDTESIELLKVSSKFQSQKVHCYQKNACHVRNSSDLRNLLEVTVKKTSLEYKQGFSKKKLPSKMSTSANDVENLKPSGYE